MYRALIVAPLLLVCACRQATVGEEGAQEIRAAHPLATMKAADRAYAVSPSSIPASAKGPPIQQPLMH